MNLRSHIFAKQFALVAILSFASEGFTARHSDGIQKKIDLPVSCAKELAKELKLSPLGKAQTFKFTVRGAITSKMSIQYKSLENTISLSETGDISIGPFFWDRTGAIPRRAGPRYEMNSESVPVKSEFKDSWKMLEDFLRAKNLNTKRICQTEGFYLEIELWEGMSFSEKGERFAAKALYLRLGELIDEIEWSGDFQ